MHVASRNLPVLKLEWRYNGTLTITPLRNSAQPQWIGITRDLWLTALILITSIISGQVFVVLHEPDIISKSAVMLWALACLGAGTLLGLIFGIPRAASEARPGSENPAKLGDGGNYHLRANTNMEQISDWLTKLLVGAGLVELKSLPHYLHSAANYVAGGLGIPKTQPDSSSFAAALIIYFCVEGFLGGYLATRMFFQSAFQRSDETLTAANEIPGPRRE
jgi:hypothetical protein